MDVKQFAQNELSPELFSAFAGDAPLETLQAHFATRRALLEAYGRMQAAVYSETKNHPDKCDMCSAATEPEGWVEVEWEATVKWHPWRILWALPTLAAIGVVMATHLHFLLHLFGRKLKVEIIEVVEFTTWYAGCRNCRRSYAAREKLTLVLQCLQFLVALASGGAALFFGALTVGAIFGAWDFPFGEWLTITTFVFSSAILVASLTWVRWTIRTVCIPPVVRTRAKSPFVATGFEIHKAWLKA